MYGFASAATIKTITNDDICVIEEFMRTSLFEMLTQKAQKLTGGQSIDYEQYYGEIFASKPNTFEFTGAEKRLILIIAAHVKKIVDENGVENSNLKYFVSAKQKLSKKPKTTINQLLLVEKPSEGSTNDKSTPISEILNRFKYEGIKRKLYDKSNVHSESLIPKTISMIQWFGWKLKMKI